MKPCLFSFFRIVYHYFLLKACSVSFLEKKLKQLSRTSPRESILNSLLGLANRDINWVFHGIYHSTHSIDFTLARNSYQMLHVLVSVYC